MNKFDTVITVSFNIFKEENDWMRFGDWFHKISDQKVKFLHFCRNFQFNATVKEKFTYWYRCCHRKYLVVSAPHLIYLIGPTLLSITTFSIRTFSITTFSIKGLYVTLSIRGASISDELSIFDLQHKNAMLLSWGSFCWLSRFIHYYAECHYNECCYAECRGAI